MSNIPRGIGLPVYNGEKYLELTIKSILANPSLILNLSSRITHLAIVLRKSARRTRLRTNEFAIFEMNKILGRPKP